MAAKLPPPEALSHVIYEMWMMAECVLRLTPPLADTFTQVEKNLNLEGFVLHARCLDEFFQTDKNKVVRQDDIIPADVGYDAGKGLYPHRVTFKRMHKEITHISHTRKFDPNEKRWLIYIELAKILPVCVDFLKFIEKDNALMAFEDNAEGCNKSLRLLGELAPRCRSQIDLVKKSDQFPSAIPGTTSTSVMIVTDIIPPPQKP